MSEREGRREKLSSVAISRQLSFMTFNPSLPSFLSSYFLLFAEEGVNYLRFHEKRKKMEGEDRRKRENE